MSEPKRLFFALELPAEVQRQIVHWRAASFPEDAGRPVTAANLHLTLAFLGEVSADKQRALSAMAERIRQPGFTLTLDGASPLAERMCASGKHIAHATLRTAQGDYALDNVTVTDCTRQTQGSNFGEKVASGLSTASISITLTGELRQGKTGHVTLMK